MVHQHDQGILVTVNQDLLHFLHVAAGRALVPDFLAAAGVVNGFPQPFPQGAAQAFRTVRVKGAAALELKTGK